MTATTISTKGSSTNFFGKLWSLFKKIPPVYPIFIIIFVTLGFLNPKGYQTMNGIMTFLRPASPLAILAIGQMVVLALGGFDLSVGAIVTFCVIVSSKFLANDPDRLIPNIILLLTLGVIVGVVNGAVVSYLKVPSFITTLGMMMIVRGSALYYVGGAPQGYLTDNFRAFGRNYIQDVPFFSRIPYSFIILIILAIVAYFIFHKTNFGRYVLAIGDNMRASGLSGVRVKLIRILSFVFCTVFAVLGGILTAGYGGVNTIVGEGMEMQSIAACVIGGVMLGGGKGNVINVIFGAFTLQAIVNLLNQLGLPKPYTDAVQGLIIIGVVAYAAFSTMRKR